MARRNPMNPRYKKESQVGATRRSAASAKPKRSTGSSSTSSSGKGGTKGSAKSTASRTGRIELPPETKKLQRIVFACLGVAVVLSVLYLLLFNDKTKQGSTIGMITIGVSYGLLFVALYIDFAKVRPVTRALRAGNDPTPYLSKKGKTKKAEKPESDEPASGAEGKDA